MPTLSTSKAPSISDRVPAARLDRAWLQPAPAPLSASREPSTLLDALLREQGDLTAVERFAHRSARPSVPASLRQYRDLIPLTRPAPGQQYAFEVNLDQCSGCKACVTACHSLNGLDESETWRSVGTLFGGTPAQPYQQSVTTACHHCLDPECLNGCPVLAYEKDPITGIVHHLDDQCIGCQYCVMKCPYEVPRYSSARGIVRKCDLCSSRLAADEAPACAQACPTAAIRITLVTPEAVRDGIALTPSLVPSAPASHHTLPTTRYLASKPFPTNTHSASQPSLTPAPAHLPLVLMLVLTQLGTGLLAGAAILLHLRPAGLEPVANFGLLCGSLALCVGLTSSFLHLGQPLKAWRAFLGWRTSWLSREILVFGACAPIAWLATGSAWTSAGAWTPFLATAAALLGLGGVACSAMIYIDTPRPWWKAQLTAPKFFGSTILLGLAGTFALLALNGATTAPIAPLLLWATGLATAAVGVAKLSFEMFTLQSNATTRPWAESITLLRTVLPRVVLARFCCGALGTLVLPAGALLGGLIPGNTLVPAATLLALLFTLAGEGLERLLFFTAEASPKMPGGIAS